jgi:hypothetical protein
MTMLSLHIALGACGFVLGAFAVALPKFGHGSVRHRWTGRAYAVCMLSMAFLSIPLSLRQSDGLLLVIGLLTIGWAAGGWIALRRALRVRHASPQAFAGMLRIHVIMMGSSYIAAWTAFLVNVRPLGGGSAVSWLYILAPTIAGSLLIARATAGLARPA